MSGRQHHHHHQVYVPFLFQGLTAPAATGVDGTGDKGEDAGDSASCVTVRGERGELLRVGFPKPDVARVTFLPEGARRVQRSYIVTGDADDDEGMNTSDDPEVAMRHGRDRDALFAAHSAASAVVTTNASSFSAETDAVRVSAHLVQGEPVTLQWAYNGRACLSDLGSTAYTFQPGPHGAVRHYQAFDKTRETCVGLGEAAGRVNRNGTRTRLSAIDAMGYDCDPTRAVSNPLYKHYPMFFVQVRPPADEAGVASPVWVGILYDSGAQGAIDLGSEVSAFRGAYRYVELEDGDLEYYLVFGESLQEVSQKMTALIGKPAITPKWCLGYIGSTMAYTEAPDAQEQLKKFVSLCRDHDIPCDGFHLSSGYTCVDTDDGGFGSRCVFHWNHRRVPNPEEMFQGFNEANIGVIPNIKPWLIKGDHPKFDEAVTTGVCLSEILVESEDDIGDCSKTGRPLALAAHTANDDRDDHSPARGEDGDSSVVIVEPHLGLFWSGGEGTFRTGAYVDFSGEPGFRWWVDNCREQLLRKGARGLWIDNNEYEVSNGLLRCRNGLSMSVMRPVQGLLMAMAAETALLSEAPNARPVVVTRSGSPGMHRHCVQTWSGDNRTNWRTLQWNIAMSLSLSICGWPGCGFDVGGFAGKMPEPELLVRWVQAAAFFPRFSIHSWNSDQTCTEPWSYPESTDVIRACIKTRYAHIPYLYDLHINAHMAGLPVVRPLIFAFPNEPAYFDIGFWDDTEETSPYVVESSSCDYMLGDAMLVCPIYTKKTSARDVYLPGAEGETKWFLGSAGTWHTGGQVVRSVSCGLDASAPIVFYRGNSIVVTSPAIAASKEAGEPVSSSPLLFTIYTSPPADGATSAEGCADAPTVLTYQHIEDDGVSLAGKKWVYDIEVTISEEAVDCVVGVSLEDYCYRHYNPAVGGTATTDATCEESPRKGEYPAFAVEVAKSTVAPDQRNLSVTIISREKQ